MSVSILNTLHFIVHYPLLLTDRPYVHETDGILVDPLLFVNVRFMFFLSSAKSVCVRWCFLSPSACFGHAENLKWKRIETETHVRQLSGVCSYCPVYFLSLFVILSFICCRSSGGFAGNGCIIGERGTDVARIHIGGNPGVMDGGGRFWPGGCPM